jgi:ferric-dicitrate binding protein FerR (iron transport regulator)
MHVLRGVLALSLCVSLFAYNLPLYAGGKPLGILTLAYGAHLNASDAFAGLSVFDGESLSTDAEGKLSARIGGSVITLVERSAATLQRSGDGAHIDLDAGAVYVWSAESNPLEVHVEGALLRPHGARQVQAQILMFAPKILQITTRQGSVDFSYGKEFRVLPEGQTYRIYLESEDDPRSAPDAGNDAQKAGMSTATKVAYFIVAGASAGLAAWGIHDLIQSHNGVESPAKP